MQTIDVTDFLQFKNFSDSPHTSLAAAEIDVESAAHSVAGSSSRPRANQLSELIYDIGTAVDMKTNNAAVTADDRNCNSGKLSLLSIECYQQFFNVDMYMVLQRIANSIIPRRAEPNYLCLNIGQNPDMYGPFWIAVTLIFSIAISGNIASYLQHVSDNYQWHYNFHLVSYAASCIFLYAGLVPVALWAIFKYSLVKDLQIENSNFTPSLLSLVCIYGYSLSIYIPVSILWVIQISLLQWVFVITAACLSGVVLITVLSPALRNSKFSAFLLIGILAAHFLLATGFMLYFFHVPHHTAIQHGIAVTETIQNIKVNTIRNGTT